jgi:hypothetical protein
MTSTTLNTSFAIGSADNSLSVTLKDELGVDLVFTDVRIRVYRDFGRKLIFTSVLSDAEIAVDGSKITWTPSLAQSNMLRATVDGRPANVYTLEVKVGGSWSERCRGSIDADGSVMAVEEQASSGGGGGSAAYFRSQPTSDNVQLVTSFPNPFQVTVFATEVFDVGGLYNTTLKRWIPPAGPVLIEYTMQVIVTGGTGSENWGYIYKNGAELCRARADDRDGKTHFTIQDKIIDVADGDDYYEIWASGASDLSTFQINTDNQRSHFSGAAL